MADNNWDDLGEELKDAVNDAINSGDFGDLAGSIGDMVNGALYSFSKGVSSSMRDVSQRANDRNRMAGDMGRMAGDMGRMAGNMGRMAGGMGRAFGQATAQMAGGVAQMANDMSARQRADMAASQGLPLYDKSPAKASCVLLMAIGYPLMGLGIFFSAVMAFAFGVAGSYFLAPLILFLAMAVGGTALGIGGTNRFKMLSRFSKYTYRLEEHAYISVEELAKKVGKSVDYTMKDLEKMIGQHLFYQAHLDYDNKYLILSDRTYEQYQMAREDFKKEQAEKKAKEAEEDKLPEECRKLIAEGQRYVAHIRECNDAIPGEEISRKLDKMEQLVQRIFEEVKIHPEVAGDLHKMMEYYLPMTEKLLDSYRELDAQPVAGENVTKTKHEIEDAVDSLNVAFEKLLDSLFADRAWDISSDISVLNTMLAQEGLKEDDFSAKK